MEKNLVLGYRALFLALWVLLCLSFWVAAGITVVLLAFPVAWFRPVSYPLGKALEYIGDKIEEFFW